MNARAVLDERAAGHLPAALVPEPGERSGALLDVLAHYADLVDDALGAAPGKLRLAFLDALGVTLLAPGAARAPLVFVPAPDAPVDVLLPAGSEAAADVPPPLPSTLGPAAAPAAAPEPIVFATEQSISVARARLASIVSVLPAEDRWADHAAGASTGLTLFDGLGPVPHHLYLGHDTLFELPAQAEVSVTIGLSEAAAGATRGLELMWEYLTGDGWIAFDPVLDFTRGLRGDGDVRLRKECGPRPIRATIAGHESFWVRARTTEPLPLPGSPGESPRVPRVDRLRTSVRYRRADLPLDEAAANGIPVDSSREFLPFGAEPQIGSTFVFACDEAFGRPGASLFVRVSPAASSAALAGTRTLTWEYSTGEGRWAEAVATSEQFEKGSAREVRFERPDDWARTHVGGAAHYWLRVRLTTGTYGGPVEYTVAGNGKVTISNAPTPPVLDAITVAYEYATASVPLDHCLTLNGFRYEDRTAALFWGRDGVVPFTPLPDAQPAVQLGFDAPLPVGLISLLVHAGDDAEAEAPVASAFAWEYRSPAGWTELPVLDESSGFATTGMLQFVGPPDGVPDAGPGGELYWIRGRLKAAGRPDPLPVHQMAANAVWATARRTVAGEVVGRADGTPRLVLTTQHTPVLAGQRLEVQEWSGDGAEWQSLFRDVPAERVRLERNPRGTVVAVWVAWEERPYLHASAPGDRHYVIERSAGLLRFGDGVAGMQPPAGAAISLGYTYGGGPNGNVAAGRIAQLHSAVPHVQAVVNPLAGSGGAPAETPAAVRARGGQQVRHRDRALTAADYEWLARDASAEVAIARCLAATGEDGPGRPGAVTIVIAPAGAEAQPKPSAGLLRRVRAYLAQRAPAAVAAGLRVTGPAYRPVSVVAQLALAEADQAARVEEALRRALDGFLHPLTGGPDGGGWAFGASVHLSQVAAVVAAVPGVAATLELALSSERVAYADAIAVEPDRLPAAGDHLLALRVGAR